ncbi:radical SAM protein [Acidimicrobiaceae bacterium USS-CC1]|uniref:Radical SAM protein n=1 Tax=Acidiferrimicrobium australe TaxID=2664430 RepID=A0ABW9QVD3_9ACTN|nr:radical SAM protein [Acidiferrimicrobium australe]
MRSSPAAVPAPPEPGTGTSFGVYVHIPFCAHRCDYCAFATWDDRPQLAPDYVLACRAEIDRAVDGGMPAATSVFFGGGTPSLLPAGDLVSILDAIPRRDGVEVTVECNPEHADPDRLAAWRRGGVTRLSFGVQSMGPVRARTARPAPRSRRRPTRRRRCRIGGVCRGVQRRSHLRRRR